MSFIFFTKSNDNTFFKVTFLTASASRWCNKYCSSSTPGSFQKEDESVKEVILDCLGWQTKLRRLSSILTQDSFHLCRISFRAYRSLAPTFFPKINKTEIGKKFFYILSDPLCVQLIWDLFTRSQDQVRRRARHC